MSYETILYEVSDGIATLTLHRPDRLNAFNLPMMHELLAVFDRIDGDDAVRAVIVTGAGKAFCAGADLSDGPGTFSVPATDDSHDAPARSDGSLNYASEEARDSGGRVTLRIFQCLKPLIAAINGPAVGVGATMTLPMDIRLASERARAGGLFEFLSAAYRGYLASA